MPRTTNDPLRFNIHSPDNKCFRYIFRQGGWVVDGFPLTRENWAAMIEHDLLPDSVVSLEDSDAPKDYLLKRFTQLKGLPDQTTAAEAVKEEEEENKGEQVTYAKIVHCSCMYQECSNISVPSSHINVCVPVTCTYIIIVSLKK